ncbi:hypothetical protein Dimus_011190, partial [Dionaea muscipula]
LSCDDAYGASVEFGGSAARDVVSVEGGCGLGLRLGGLNSPSGQFVPCGCHCCCRCWWSS